jgi:signal transduction histidine kinase/ligand-binding sensor domain-containing protein/DNA-binding NarL/FixJ family response regulator
MKNYICPVIFFCLSIVSFAQQQLSFEQVSPGKGFTAPIIKSIIQDKEGFLWFGSLNGFYRFDGFNLKSYLHDPNRSESISHGYVNFIYEDNDNNLLVGTSTGLNKLDRYTEDFQQYFPDTLGQHIFKNWIWSVFEDSRGVLWTGAMGLYFMNDSTGKLQSFVFPSGLEVLNNVSFQSINEDLNGFLWFGTSMGLFKFDPAANNLIPVHVDPDVAGLFTKNWNTGDYSTPCIYKDNSNFLWVGSYGGKLLCINPFNDEITSFLLIDPLTSEPFPILSITYEDDNSLWLGTYKGLVLFDKLSGKIIAHYKYDENDKSSISDDKITTVLKDKSGTLWIGTLSAGLCKANRTKFPFNKITNKQWGITKLYNLVTYTDFFVSRSGSLFIGTENGIEEIKPDHKERIKHKPYNAINVLMEDTRGNHWIGLRQSSGGGVFKKDPSGNILPIIDSTGKVFTKEIHCIFESSDGKIYFGAEFYLFEIDPARNVCSLVFQTRAKIHSIGEDNNKNILLGTLLAGLFVFNPEHKKALNNFLSLENDLSSLPSNDVLCIYKDKVHRIWLSTSLGLCLYDPSSEKFKRYIDVKGFTHNTILCITEDNSGNLWLGTARNISRFDPDGEIFRSYDDSYGTIEGFHYAGGMANGKIFMKARTGITYFEPDKVKDNPFIPPVKVTDIKVFDKPYSFQEELILSHSENYLSFEFAALSFISPERNQYAYKMEGVDKDWVYSGARRYAAYTDLKPGEYHFRVKASNNDGVWNNEGTTLSLVILPPWWQTYWAYGSYFLAFILLLYAWRRYDLKRQNLKYQLEIERQFAEKQREISEMKSRFFTNISHEFRTPITLIIGPADQAISVLEEGEIKKYVMMMKKNALRLLRLINQLLDISRLDERRLKLQAAYSNLVPFVKGIIMIFESFAESKDISLSIKAEKDEINLYFDKEKMEKILINLISNACKFTDQGGRITVTISEMTGAAVIKVKDTGIGIPSKEIPKLFDRFYQVDSSHTREHGGTGIGLALAKELIELHSGNISVNSVEGEWTEFTIELPLGKKHLKEDEIISVTDELNDNHNRLLNLSEQIHADLAHTAAAFEQPEHTNAETVDEKEIILIVEDNSDVRDYIKNTLGGEFQIEEASNGEQGFRKALSIIPDLVISDIMMPRSDGYQLTRTLKNDERTNHIPVILLTAKSAPQDKLDGLEIGADDYLIKPFDLKELRTRIHNLINIRKTLQEKYSNPDRKIKHDIKKLKDPNERFMKKVIEIIQSNVGDENFNIEDFGKELGMGRVQLHRKLKAITGKSASRYLRSYRLLAAKQMIDDQKGNISEIAYSVGFSSPVYFAKCFKEEFGFTASEYKSRSSTFEITS